MFESLSVLVAAQQIIRSEMVKQYVNKETTKIKTILIIFTSKYYNWLDATFYQKLIKKNLTGDAVFQLFVQ